MLPAELPSVVAFVAVAGVVAVVLGVVVEVIPVDVVVVVVFGAVVEDHGQDPAGRRVVVVVVVIPVGAMVGGAGHSPGSATGPNSLPETSGP